ncbi:BTAD domain-containing putative transcriptional regulator [Streptomyces roseifaciens]
MQFRMLGPLQAVSGHRTVALGGTKQRATLGFLLLNANRVVATSRLLNALWEGDDAPASARKILQNAVWGLRGALFPDGDDTGRAALLTQAPGYVMRVDPDDVDLYLFHRRVGEGRAKLAAGSPQEAAVLLRAALALWRGPVLADLMEAGFAWPEATAVQNARLDAMEDYCEAELACGRHHAVLGELETLVEAEPLRERSCGQLMLALYRCGRQADALSVYGRVRTALVEELGLEPGRDLQELQQAILTHDRTLALPGVPAGGAAFPGGGPGARREREAFTVASPPPAGTSPASAAAPDAAAGHGAPVSERRNISVLMLRTVVGTGPAGPGAPDADTALEDAAVVVRRKVEAFGGTLSASIGSVSLALFGVGRADEDGAERAVRAALAVRDCFHDPSPAPGAPGPAVMAAVGTGQARVRVRPGDPGGPPSVTGTLLDACESLLAQVPAGTVRVCEETLRATRSAIAYRGPDGVAAGRHASGALQEFAAHHRGPVVDREYELEVLGGLLERARHRAVPHLVTVLGEAGSGKSRLVMEFGHRAAGLPEAVRFLSAPALPAAEDGPLSVHARILAACCGILPEDTHRTAADKLAATVEGLVGPGERAQWLRSCLTPLAVRAPAAPGGPAEAMPDAVRAWRRLMAEIAREQPLVVAVDDVHRADDRLLDVVEDLAESAGAVPLLVIAAARPELLVRRPGWGGGRRHATTITLGPVPDTAPGRPVALPVPSARPAHLPRGVHGARPEPVRSARPHARPAKAALIPLQRNTVGSAAITSR